MIFTSNLIYSDQNSIRFGNLMKNIFFNEKIVLSFIYILKLDLS